MNESLSRERRFGFACLFELALGVIAAILVHWMGRPLWADLKLAPSGWLVGVLAATPIFGLLWWVLASSSAAAGKIRYFLGRTISPFFGDWSRWQLVVLASIAGLCEELLFRAAIQGGLTPHLGGSAALLISAALFAMAHLVTWTYAFLTFLTGLYLGLIWNLTGNLLVPIVAHAVYDIVALVYLQTPPPTGPEDGLEPDAE
jgi:hypothetical protein